MKTVRGSIWFVETYDEVTRQFLAIPLHNYIVGQLESRASKVQGWFTNIAGACEAADFEEIGVPEIQSGLLRDRLTRPSGSFEESAVPLIPHRFTGASGSSGGFTSSFPVNQVSRFRCQVEPLLEKWSEFPDAVASLYTTISCARNTFEIGCEDGMAATVPNYATVCNTHWQSRVAEPATRVVSTGDIFPVSDEDVYGVIRFLDQQSQKCWDVDLILAGADLPLQWIKRTSFWINYEDNKSIVPYTSTLAEIKSATRISNGKRESVVPQANSW